MADFKKFGYTGSQCSADSNMLLLNAPTLLQEQTKNAQFIIISLRNNMFEMADRLIGIYKTHNTTKNVAINPKTIVLREIETA